MLGTVFYIGYLLGNTIGGLASDYLGRKVPLIISAAFLLCFGLLSAVCPSYLTYILCRGPIGIGIGMYLTNLTPYLTEIFPLHTRGKALSFRAQIE